ncbi:MAG: DUF2723 domain-containing protein [Verrucomicrobia bacterium]|nr:DUF2723 domain-containing protein [Verrucomicrobiota bacterium]
MKKASPRQSKSKASTKEPEISVDSAQDQPLPRLYRGVDWTAFAVSFIVVLIAYVWTIAPDLTLEDSGELAVASYYAGIPHPPGYPAWTLYTWVFANFIPFSNIAWRVAFGSAFAGALSAGLLALMVSRGSSMMMDSIPSLKGIHRQWENAVCLVSGFLASGVLAFSSYIWSQAVIVEVYAPSVLSLVGVLCCLFRWNYAPHQRRYLYLAFFIFGICFTNHQTLLLAAMGIEVAIAAANNRMGRGLFLWNTAIYLMGLVLHAQELIFMETNPMFFVLFNMVGVASIAAYLFFSIQTKEGPREYLRDGLLVLSFVLAALIPKMGVFVGLLALGSMVWCGMLVWQTRQQGMEVLVVFLCGLCWLAGVSFYLYMPIAGMTNPPMQWGYPRIVEGFIHALTRGQYEKTAPGDVFGDPIRFLGQLRMLFENASEEFSFVFLFIALVPFFFLPAMKRRERAWIIGLTAIYFCLAVLLIIILNPPPDSTDRSARSLIRVFFTASHVPVALMVGYGTSLVAAQMCTHYAGFRRWGMLGGTIAVVLALLSLSQRVAKTMDTEGAQLGLGQVACCCIATAHPWL